MKFVIPFSKAWFDKLRADAIKKVAVENASAALAMANCQKLVDTATAKMTSKPCAINDMEPCRKDCVHFRAGYVYDFGGSVFPEYPKCRLWQ